MSSIAVYHCLFAAAAFGAWVLKFFEISLFPIALLGLGFLGYYLAYLFYYTIAASLIKLWEWLFG